MFVTVSREWPGCWGTGPTAEASIFEWATHSKTLDETQRRTVRTPEWVTSIHIDGLGHWTYEPTNQWLDFDDLVDVDTPAAKALAAPFRAWARAREQEHSDG